MPLSAQTRATLTTSSSRFLTDYCRMVLHLLMPRTSHEQWLTLVLLLLLSLLALLHQVRGFLEATRWKPPAYRTALGGLGVSVFLVGLCPPLRLFLTPMPPWLACGLWLPAPVCP